MTNDLDRVGAAYPVEAVAAELTTWSDIQPVHAAGSLVHGVFEQQVARTPTAVALEHEDGSLTYAELNDRANQLARYLVGQGVGPDRLVGICLERGFEMVVAMLAAWKAGGAYVPLDPSYPSERLAYMLRDAAPTVVLTQDAFKERLPQTAGTVVTYDQLRGELATYSTSNLDPQALGLRDDHLVYVIYTSGSTGRPKGVMVEHRNLASLLPGLERLYRQSGGCERVAVNASFNFDASVKQFVQLLAGRTLVLVPQKVRWDAAMLLKLIHDSRVDCIDCTPSQLRSWISAGLLEQQGHRPRMVLVGGEAIDSQLWSRLAQSADIDFYNLYGPTESTVDTTAAYLKEGTDTPHIGRPLENRHVYLLDADRQPVPAGATGEIYIGGEGVARGYLNRSDLTAERFIPDPYGSHAHAQLYKTGDLGRWQPDGTLEYLGRNDDQVKIRGFRIELGEIEAQLLRHGQIEAAAVIARDDAAGERRLVAYIVPRGESAPEVGMLQEHLRAVLPEFMVPAAFVILEHLPLSPSGKLDRQALPPPGLSAYVSRQYEPPQGEVEELLARIWQQVLDLERVGRDDNFFELGGHSLLMVDMLERLRRAGWSAEIQRVFASTTLADLAGALAREAVGETGAVPNGIPPACEQITPRMLPLVELEPEHIERIVRAIPGGAANVQDIYPLAPLQEGVLFHHLLDGQGSDAYARIVLLALPSREKLERFIAALQAAIDRHDVLRTAVLWEQLPQAVQVVCRQATLPVEEIALDPQGDPVEQLRERMSPQRRGLDLRHVPLMRLQIAADPRSSQWYVLLQTHHLVCDTQSLDLLASEITLQLEGRTEELPEPALYRDHVAQSLACARARDSEAFFREKLADIDEPTAPFGLLDVRGDGSRIENAGEELPIELARRIRGQARRLGVTPATLFHAAWSLVVAHTAGRDDVVFGSVLLGRLQTSAAARHTLGMFINTLPLRVRLQAVTAKELVMSTQRELADLLAHEQAPLAVAQRCSNVDRSAPLFTALLNYQHSMASQEGGWLQSAGLTVLHRQGGSNYPIVLSVDDRGDSFVLEIEVDRDIDPHRVLGYAREAVLSLIQALEVAPLTPALALSILPENERGQVLELFNATRAAYPRTLVHQLFEQQVRRTPDAVAVAYEDRQLTYEQLDRRANQLARLLRRKGVGPDRLVGLCVERAPELVVGMLGILKAGGAYVPLDLRYPADRIRHILVDSSPVVLLTQEESGGRIPHGDTEVILLDGRNSPLNDESDAALDHDAPQLQPHHLTYVIYTSGSTGTPKGVMIEHRSLANLIHWHHTTFGVRSGSRCSSVAAVGFDAATWEVWPPLTVGGTLVLAPSSTTMDPESLVHWWKKESLDVSFLPTPVAELFFSANDPVATPRVLLVGGDRLRHRAVSGAYTLVNNYGPTETTVVATSGTLLETDSVLHIGRPIANTRTYILDSRQCPVPLGVYGELHVGGLGVARGYLNRPDLTAERFIHDPFSTEPGARLYRTGDVCRWRADGTLEYGGRADEQVKIRGYRIELGEIEAQLRQQPRVKEAVVIVREDSAGDKALVAYVVAHDEAGAEAALDVEALRAELALVLPQYMVPGAFVALASLPLTANGKVDRRALPAPQISAYAHREYEEPRGELEELLAQAWKAVLGIERVGRHDSFFELGGHSLLAVRVISRIREKLGLEVRISELFAHPVLAQFAQTLQGRRREHLPGVVRITRHGDLELSYAQQRLWFLAQMPGVSEAYHITWGVGLIGELDRDALRRALDRIVQRHEALRTRFEEVDGRPVQRIEAEHGNRFELLEQDIAPGLPAQDAQRELALLADEEARASFDLRRGPLIRGRLIRLDALEHALLITMHHIVSDGWSMGVFVRELSALYTAHCRGEADPLSPLAVQYPDYAPWERQWLAGPRLEEQRQYWESRLAGAPTLLSLPTDHPRPAEQQYAGGVVKLVLDEELTAGLKELSRRHGTTLFMTLLAAWTALLGRLSGQDDVVIGTPVANRGRAEIEGLIGFFVNTLALRVDLSGAPTVTELLQRVKECALGAQEHQDLPFDQLVEWLQPVRSLAHSPLFQVMFAWESAPEGRLELPGLSSSPLASRQCTTAKFDLTLTLSELGQRIVGELEYSSALYERRTIDRYAGYLKSLLTGMVADADQSLDRVPLLSSDERHQVLVEWNTTRKQYPVDKCIHELFEEQVARTPEAVALVYEKQKLTYAQLNARANQLARHVRELGVKPDTRVALCTERSLEMVVGILAVLKAGGTYVPLDPQYPLERLRYMLEDSAPCAVLTHAPVMDGVHGRWLLELGERMPVLDLSSQAPRWRGQPESNPTREGLLPNHLAYVIYTSGSTGQPKGVMVEHASVLNLIHTHIHNCALDATDRVLQFASFGFDASVEELFPGLSVGARVVLRPRGLLAPDLAFEELIRDEGITVAELPTAFWHQWVGERQATHVADDALRLVIVGGEKAERQHLDSWRAGTRWPKSAWLNTYGPTEATVYSCALLLQQGTGELPEGEVPIGHPVSNTQIYILDSYGSPVPVGVAGEIYIGGAGIARGYLNRPELTAERFLKDPFSADPKARMYRTGDLGRWRADGNIEYLGRNDAQVKIRGFRIELGEIEARLRECAGVREAVVLAREEGGGDKRLVAYYTAAVESGLSAASLQSHLTRNLPVYMVPKAFVQLERLPVTANGKLDRKALPVPDIGSVVTRAYEAPVGEIELTLAQVWQDILKLERIGRHDNFFELGGHSLLAVMLRSRLRRALQIELSLRDIFAHPVLMAMAQVLKGVDRSEQATITPVSRCETLPISFAQQRLWFLAQMPGLSEAYHVPVGLRLQGDLDRDALKRALDRVVWRHEALRTNFRQVEDQVVQHVKPADSGFSLQEHDLSSHPQPQLELERRMREEAAAPFDLLGGALIRGLLIKLSERDHALLITMHHIVSDGWSIETLLEDLSRLYRDYHAGREDQLPTPTIQYADYTIWQRQLSRGTGLQRQAEYWRRALDGAPTALELPTDRPRPAHQQFTGDMVKLELDASLVRALRSLSERHGMTLYMTVLAGWAAVLSRLSGQEEVVIGTPVANRTRTETEAMVGFFVNMQALRIRVSGNAGELLEAVKARTVEAQDHQDLPFEQVVEIVKAPRVLSHTPVFQVMLSWENPAQGGLDLPGLGVSPLEVPYSPAKFDLDLELRDAGDRVVGALRYATSLFDRITIERHVGYLQRMLVAMAADEQQGIDAIDMVGAEERRQLLVEWNDTQAPYPQERCVQELFEEQVAQAPNAVALALEEQTLTYADLNSRANQLAHYLRGLGVRPDDRIAICMERSLEMVVGIIAVLKAGGAYVPLDPGYPAERLVYMLKDSAPVALLTQAALRDTLQVVDRPVVTLDLQSDLEMIARQPTHDLQREAVGLTPSHLAYVIYTSGSTGQPKGAMNEHRALINRLQWAQKTFSLGPDDRVLQKTPVGFDVSVWEILHPLLAGATLVMARPQGHKDPQYLAQVIESSAITTLHFVPSILQVFLEQLSEDGVASGRFPNLKRVLCSGEALGRALQRRLHAALPHVQLHNLYGPTEAAIDVTWHACDPEGARSTVPIGRPIDNTHIYILDGHRRPVPAGVVGEIYIGGVPVARGYLNRPQLTEERFVPDPFATHSARMYKTGDLGKWLTDSNIDYVGRNDFQVKIRGLRIELGEIEARLAQYPGVREAVVLAREDHPGDKRLVAYYTVGTGVTVSATALQDHLGRSLPDYMVPAVYVELERLPLTANGKLDRQALPAPGVGSAVTVGYEAPEGEVEVALARIWQTVLQLERVGRHDDFFKIGGNSILAVQMISRVNRECGTNLRVYAAFECKTVAALAAAVRSRAGNANEADALKRVDLADGVAPTFPQMAILRDPSKFNMCRAMWIDGAFDEEALRRSLAGLVTRQDALRAHFMGAGMAVRMHVRSTVPDVLRIVALEGEESLEQRVRFEIDKERRLSFNLQEGPPVRALLLRISPEKHVLVVCVHHVVADAWSLNIVKNDLAAFYAAEVDNSLSKPGPLPIRFGDFVDWQRRLRETEDYQRQFAYWVGVFTSLAVQGNFPVSPESSAGGRALLRSIELQPPMDWSQRLRELAARTGVTPYAILTAALHLALADYSGLEQQMVWTPISRRTQVELEESVGMYTNLMVVAQRVEGNLTTGEFLALIERKVTRGMANADVSALAVVMKNPSARPTLPVIGLNYIDSATQGDAWTFSGTTVTSIEISTDDESPVTALEVVAVATPDSLSITAGYDTAIFHADAVRLIVNRLIDATDALVGDPGLSLADLLQSWRAQRELAAELLLAG